MSLEISDKTQSIFYAEIGPKDSVIGNFMGVINVVSENDIVLNCRFRFYRDDKTFDSDDEKKWFDVHGKSLEDMRKRTLDLLLKMNDVGAWVLHRGALTTDQMAQQLMMAPFANVRTTTGSIN